MVYKTLLLVAKIEKDLPVLAGTGSINSSSMLFA